MNNSRSKINSELDCQWEIGFKVLNRFLIEDIKEGGFGVVYLVQDLESNQRMAIKSFKKGCILDEDAVESFITEINVWIDLKKHSNIIFAGFVEIIEKKPFIFLEFAEENLNECINKLEIEEFLDFAIQFCNGMEYAHNKIGTVFVHRDIKPDNILFSTDNRFKFNKCFKITDFGLVKAIKNAKISSGHISSGKGTPEYAPPEQFPTDIKNEFNFIGEVTIQSDIYSFGFTCYQILTGEYPYYSAEEKFLREPPNPIDLNSNIPENIANIILKCLARNQNDRYKNFLELKEEFMTAYMERTNVKYTIIGSEEELTFSDINNRGIAYLSLQKYEKSINCFDIVLNSPNDLHSVAFSNKGNALDLMGKHDEAIECYENALNLNEEATTWNNLGVAYSAKGRVDDAIQCYKKAIELDQQYSVAYSNFGMALYRKGRLEHAIILFNHALKYDKRNVDALNNKGLSLYNMGYYSTAMKCFNEAHKINPRLFHTYYNKALIFNHFENIQGTIECLQKFVYIHENSIIDDVNRHIDKIEQSKEVLMVYLFLKWLPNNKDIVSGFVTYFFSLVELNRRNGMVKFEDCDYSSNYT